MTSNSSEGGDDDAVQTVTTEKHHNGDDEAPLEDVDLARAPTTFLQVLKHNVDTNPNHIFVKWVDKACNVTNILTYQELWDKSGLVVELLETRKDVEVGDRIMIAYPSGLEFLSGFIGCMRFGAIACSVYPPNFVENRAKAKQTFAQFNQQVSDTGATIALTSRKYKRSLTASSFALLGPKTKGVKWIPTDHLTKSKKSKTTASAVDSNEAKPDDVAFIQYSSGSTNVHTKGVTIRHGALLHHLKCVQSDNHFKDGSVEVMWLPQYHEFCLIGGYLLSCFTSGGTLVICSPLDFMENPTFWVDMLEKFQATHTGGPHFAYALLAKRMEENSRTLAAPNLIQASIGSPPIASSTLIQLEGVGFHRSIITTRYGMAEVCFRATSAAAKAKELSILDGIVCSGYLPRNEKENDMTVKIASYNNNNNESDNNDNNNEGCQILPDGQVGQVYLRGMDVTMEYWNEPNLTQQYLKVKLSDGFEYSCTGDLGKIVDNRLYVLGRAKEVIVIDNKNIYPTDIERIVEQEYPNVVRSTVAFQRSDTDVGLIFEIRKSNSKKEKAPQTSVTAIRKLVWDHCHVHVGLLMALKEGSVPKTVSGELMRIETRRRCLEDCWDSNQILLKRTLEQERTPGNDDDKIDGNIVKPVESNEADNAKQAHYDVQTIKKDDDQEEKREVQPIEKQQINETTDDQNVAKVTRV